MVAGRIPLVLALSIAAHGALAQAVGARVVAAQVVVALAAPAHGVTAQGITAQPDAGLSAPAQSAPDEPAWPIAFESDGMTGIVEQVATGLSRPVGLVFLPDGRGILADQGTGTLSLIDLGTGETRGLEGVPPNVLRGEGGVHDVQLHPDFASTSLVYFSYAVAGPDSTTSIAVARGRLSGHTLLDVEVLLQDDESFSEAAHYGLRLVLTDGYLFISSGDRRTRGVPQSLASLSGKVLRLHDDGSVPEDNPFVHVEGARPEIWSYGHRNPQGLVLDAGTGLLWSTEHGPQGGDEVNIVLPGRNYGWPLVSFGEEYGGGPVGTGVAELPGIELPRYYYRPSIAPSGASFYSGAAFPAWRGDLFVGALGLRHLNRLVVREGRVIREERLFEEMDERVRFVTEGPDGSLYLGVDSGALLRVRPR